MKSIYSALLMTALLCACNADQQRMEKAMKDYKLNRPFCFGRLVIDLPEEAEIIAQHYDFYWNPIKQFSESHDEFISRVNALVDQYKDKKHVIDPFQLTKHIEISKNDYITFYWNEPRLTVLQTYQAMAWREGVTTVFSEETRPDSVHITAANMTTYLKNFTFRKNDVIPKEQGFCLNNGFIADDGKNYQRETAAFGFRLKSHPELRFWVSSRVKTVEVEESLLERFNKPHDVPAHLADDWKKILYPRKDVYTTKHFKGDALYMHYPPQRNGESPIDYEWESMGTYHDVLRPKISIRLQSIDPVDEYGTRTVTPTLPDEETAALLDAVINTLRPRVPLNSAQTTSTEKPATLRTGDKVLVNGIYEHQEHNTQTPQRLKLNAGERLPPVFKKRSRTFSEWLKGYPSQSAVEVQWVLVKTEDNNEQST